MSANAVSGNFRPETSRLSQIGCAALVLIGAVVSVPRTLASTGVPEGVWLIDNEVAVSSLRLQQSIVWPRRMAVDPARSSGWVGSRQEEPGPGIAAASVVWLDHLLGVATCGSRPVDRWLVLQPGRRGNLQYLSGTQVRRHDRGAHLFERPALWQTKMLYRVPHGTSNGWC